MDYVPSSFAMQRKRQRQAYGVGVLLVIMFWCSLAAAVMVGGCQ